MNMVFDDIYTYEDNFAKDIIFKAEIKNGKPLFTKIVTKSGIDVSDYTVKEFLEEVLDISKMIEE